MNQQQSVDPFHQQKTSNSQEQLRSQRKKKPLNSVRHFLYPESSFQQINGKLAKPSSNQVLKTGTPKYLNKIDGNMLILAQGASGGNYSHWLLDILPKLKLASLQYNLNKIDYFYFSKLN